MSEDLASDLKTLARACYPEHDPERDASTYVYGYSLQDLRRAALAGYELPALLREETPPMRPCTRPPRGWTCSLEAHHEGPCPASPLPEPEPKPFITRAGLAALGLVIGALAACLNPPEDPWEEFEGVLLEDADDVVLRLGT